MVHVNTFQHFCNCWLSWFYIGQFKIYVHVSQLSDYRLEFGVVDTVKGLNHSQLFFCHFIFWNGCLARRMVLLVAQQNVIQQWAVAGQKRAGDFKRYRMPHFAFFCLLINFEAVKFVNFILELNDKSNFGGGAEVPHDQKADDF